MLKDAEKSEVEANYYKLGRKKYIYLSLTTGNTIWRTY